jgi:S1-C subfamily serine protease
MKLHTLALSALLLLPLAPVTAQDEAPPPVREQVVGRNAELSGALVDVARDVSRHVVRIEENGRIRGYGVVIDGGWVLTASSVASGNGALTASGPGGPLGVTLHARDQGNDLALLRVGGGTAPAGLPFGKTADLKIGQFVVVVGTEPKPIAVGVVSAKDRAVEQSGHEQNILMSLMSDGNEGHKRAFPRVLQHDGPTSPEVFGAPVVDRKGRLVGISVAAPYRGSSHAVDVDLIASVIDGLKKGGGPVARTQPATPQAPGPAAGKPWLGVSCVDLKPGEGTAAFGLVVREVTGPAKEAGLKAGDVIQSIDGREVRTMDAFAASIGPRKIGDTVKLGVVRGAEALEVSVVLGKRP